VSEVGSQPAQEPVAVSDRLGDLLVASSTIAGIAAALAVFAPSAKLYLNLEITPGWKLPLVPLIFLFVGFLALAAALRCLDAIRREAELPFESIILVKHTLGYIFVALLLLMILYIIVVLGLVYGTSQVAEQ